MNDYLRTELARLIKLIKAEGFSDTYYFDAANDYDDEYVSVGNDHVYMMDYHLVIHRSLKMIQMYAVQVMNTREFGVPNEYARDEAHDSTDNPIGISDYALIYDREIYSYVSEEDKFQQSLLDEGIYIEFIDTVLSTLRKDFPEIMWDND